MLGNREETSLQTQHTWDLRNFCFLLSSYSSEITVVILLDFVSTQISKENFI